jgi:3-oxoacyl-(acyl-carrier-protein) synthase
MGAIALREALADAGMLDACGRIKEALRNKRIALISGTTVGGMDVTERIFTDLERRDDLLRYVSKHDCGSSTHDIASLCGLEPEDICTISTACSSALNAIIVGCEMLNAGTVDIVLAGGTEALSRFHLNGFNALMILDNQPCRPFDDTRSGLNLGEGAAYLVMTAPDAVPVTTPAKAFISGYGNACDAFHQTATSENGDGAHLAMSKALTMAHLSPRDIQYINAHGTATPDNDISESKAIQRIFKDHIPAISSTKAFTGHTTSASGAIEAVICILAMQHSFIPANLRWSKQIAGGITPSQGANDVALHNVICNSFGFGGNDSAIIISDAARSALSTQHRDAATAECVADVIIDNVDMLSELRNFITPMEGRRMCKLMKAATLSSLKAMQAAGIEKPDAIITATAYGMLENSEKFLTALCQEGEEGLSPTLFMQSTHNTIGSAIAIRTKCHGYNITYTQGAESLQWALRDANNLIATGQAETVLVGCHDEATPLFQEFMRRNGSPVPPALYSRSIILRKK